MSFERLWGYLAFALPALAGLLAPMSTVDLAYQVRAGAQMLATGELAAADTWTSTVAGVAWVNQQWAAQVLLAGVHELGGWAGLALLRAITIGLAFAFVAAACRERGAGPRVAAVLALVAFLLASPALGLRPQLFGILLFAATLWLLAGRRRAPWRTWLVPVLAVAWANVHGSFVLAPVLAGWAFLEDLLERDPAWRPSLVVAVLTALGTLVTALGPGAWAYALDLAANPAIAARVTEWQPPSLFDPVGAAFYGSLVLVGALVLLGWASGRRISLPAFGVLAGLAWLGLRAVRGVAWWPIGAVVMVAPVFGSAASSAGASMAGRETPGRARRLNAITAAGLAVIAVLLLVSWAPVDPLAGSDRVTDAPAGVTRTVLADAAPGSNLFHPQRWGSWLELAAPAHWTFVDSRIELFPDEVWADYDAIVTGADGWEAVLERRAIDVVLVAPEDEALADRLAAAGWREAYAGADGWVLVRD